MSYETSRRLRAMWGDNLFSIRSAKLGDGGAIDNQGSLAIAESTVGIVTGGRLPMNTVNSLTIFLAVPLVSIMACEMPVMRAICFVKGFMGFTRVVCVVPCLGAFLLSRAEY